ncbi:BlaI/MecI/CopY family transcriptional regulator [Mycolicibacterium goodii]|uniref:BlaI/MecI/CopY family transcriptional regulator n=1 Tax=Mycolicibacterium goodii TaxID=134601 RepID=A0ABS6HJA5_MYCGD|nr:BlaI/MecI/CopY family transcriptional regulator [Mycolicibacterium goodii]MBU8822766.1 BlaI/MecI/CopY family transcriptional regulator [Mycolicibacterium goodii]MBU8838860.1 BlaI/MecI/CopY family transcriptional regulator [Mycolicibacterium goodii]
MRVRGFGELEAKIMDRIWNHDPESVTVRDVFDELAEERQIAYTTVMSTMDNLHTKGWLERERDGRAYRYWPTLTREQHSAQLMREALDGGGRSELVLSYFIEQIDPQDSDRLRAALRTLARRSTRTKKR